MANADDPWKQATIVINGVEWLPGMTGNLRPSADNKIEVSIPDQAVRTLRLGHADGGRPEPVASPDWGEDLVRENLRFTTLISFEPSYSGPITLIAYSQDMPTPLGMACRVVKAAPILRFWFRSVWQPAPLPPDRLSIKVGDWYGVDLMLTYPDESPISGALVNFFRPDHEPYVSRTDGAGVVTTNAFKYSTVGLRTFTAEAEYAPGVFVSATLLVDVV
ncbi:hypothetical protein [Pseudomonas sp. MYb118]|uniref:hypothetical protein n=1 Tax=Pseudomonas sp. MYb118 TaxID=1848720 RepID=UPI0034CE8452